MSTVQEPETATSTATRALLFFSIGPVQPFIEKARTVRDLTTGSYLLAWLTAKAAKPILKPDCVLVTPDRALVDNAKSPTMPNRFIAEVPVDQAELLADECRRSCLDAWDKLCRAVYGSITNPIGTLINSGLDSDSKMTAEAAHFLDDARKNWDCLWNVQLGTSGKPSPFDIQTQVIPISDEKADAEHIRKNLLGGKKHEDDTTWDLHYHLTWSLDAARKQTRYIHRYSALPSLDAPGLDRNFVPGKCTMFGTYEQIGPADGEASRIFWEWLGGDDGLEVDAARLRSRERLSAIGLVKRFGWFAFLRDELNRERVARGEEVLKEALAFPDTATIAARLWLDKANEQKFDIDPNKKYRPDDGGKPIPFSGQWLHWPHPEFDKNESPCPAVIFNKILDSRRNPAIPKVPTYYAVLMLDGDFMGKLSQSLRGIAEQQRLSSMISDFATSVQSVIEVKYKGILVYAGGDDVLALLPLETALKCALELWERFCEMWIKDLWWKRDDVRAPTCSAGLAIVHYKQDLRFALDAARKAEKLAKGCRTGKNALALTVCRRSGQHATAVAEWEFVKLSVNEWVDQFRKSDETGSDAWTYQLARELPILENLDCVEAISGEISRLVHRSKVEMDHKEVASAFEDYYKFKNEPEARPKDAGFRAKSDDAQKKHILKHTIRNFVTLSQSASFLARGRDE